MSDAIYLRVKLNNHFFENATSDFLFNVIREGCSRRIAVTLVPFELIDRERDECVVSLTDSFNFMLAAPLMGMDSDEEVAEYRPEPLYIRLMNLQGLFEFILKESVVEKIDVYLTWCDEIEDLDTINIPVDDFAKVLEPMIANNRSYAFYLHCVLDKPMQ